MKLKIIILLTACLFLSCKTTKQATKTDVKSHETTALDVRETASTIAAGTATLNVDSKVNINEDMIETGTRTKWSVPDAQGKQYPQETENYTRGKKTNTKAETSAKAEDKKTVGNRLSRVDKSDYKSDKVVKTDEKKQETVKSPQWMSLGVILGIVGIFLMIYLVLKRFGAI